MKTITFAVEDDLAGRLEADARRRGVSLNEAAADHFHRLAYESMHGPVAEEDLAELDAAMAEDDRGEYASEDEVEAFFSRYRA